MPVTVFTWRQDLKEVLARAWEAGYFRNEAFTLSGKKRKTHNLQLRLPRAAMRLLQGVPLPSDTQLRVWIAGPIGCTHEATPHCPLAVEEVRSARGEPCAR